MENEGNEDEVMLPGFRFHPTDEELVGFYLRRKVHRKPLSIELIKQLDIYKFDPWDLPKLATSGEKEWYFYCPRDRKYRNSARPNRVTVAGFWKATGTDRPIYSSDGSKCIGLKKSLVFYKGRAARGTKTDWMMHEFRLPSLSPNKHLHKDIPPAEAWAICRIFKKASSKSNVQRTLSRSWISPVLSDNTTSDSNLHFSSSSYTTTTSNKTNTNMPLQLPVVYQWPNTSYSETMSQEPTPKISINDASSLLLDMSTSVLGDGVSGLNRNVDFSTFAEPNGLSETEMIMQEKVEIDDEMISFVLSSNLMWGSSPCPSQLSMAYSTSNWYT